MLQKYPNLRTSVFWIAFIGAIFMFVQALSPIFGFKFSVENADGLLTAINAIIGALVIAGILIDPHEVEGYNKFAKKVKLKE